MNLNPITALLDKFEKLINEHASASVLRDHVALLKDQIIDLERKNAALTSENAVLKSKLHDLTIEVEDLNAKIDKNQQTHADSDYNLFNH
jgi:hypothetical protein